MQKGKTRKIIARKFWIAFFFTHLPPNTEEHMQNRFTLHTGDSLHVLRTMPDNSVDSVVTDPPYGLSFMGKKWDYDVPSTELWVEVLRVLKPGGHLLAFAGTRTQHRMAVRIEDAGFEIRDMLAWVYGSGFPKSLDVSKAIDKAAGVEREVVGQKFASAKGVKVAEERTETAAGAYLKSGMVDITTPATPEAAQWAGWGTALKPALEPITLARKPFAQTVAANVLEWGTGALNIDACRVEAEARAGWTNQDIRGGQYASNPERPRLAAKEAPEGRWPANLIHDGSEEVVGLFPQTGAGHRPKTKTTGFGEFGGGASEYHGPGPKTDKGSAARFFYCAKAQKKDRNEGLTGESSSVGAKGNGLARVCEKCGIPQLQASKCQEQDDCPKSWVNPEKLNHHPTVKPTDLMAYLCRLITLPGGLILDPFMGSGSTGKAAMREGFRFIGVDLSQEFVDIARARIEHELGKQSQGTLPFAAE